MSVSNLLSEMIIKPNGGQGTSYHPPSESASEMTIQIRHGRRKATKKGTL